MHDESRLHLKVVGSFLESHRLYKRPKLAAVKQIVARLFAERYPNPLSLHELKSTLCLAEIPLFSEDVLRQALNSLHREDETLEQVDKKSRTYRLKEAMPKSENVLTHLLEGAWQRHFEDCADCTFEQFLTLVARLFSRYGCDAHATLTNKEVSNLRLSELVREIGIPDTARVEFLECLEQFVLSVEPEDASLKVRLASTYALLRMSGAGNWDKDELRAYFDGKRFLLDTNILFEMVSRSVSQVTSALEAVRDLGGRICVGRETIKEFETALRNSAMAILEIATKGVDLESLRNHAVMNADWVLALVEDGSSLSIETLHEKIDALVSQVDGSLTACGVETLSLEVSETNPARELLITEIQDLATRLRSFPKHRAVAYHDALLVEAIQQNDLADTILSLDRSLLRFKTGGRPVAAMMDDVIAYALLGTAKEEQLADLLNHFLSNDLHPDAPVLDLADIRTLANMEVNLLSSPPRVLRRAARQLSEIRHEKLVRGEVVEDDELARLFVNALSSYQDDRRRALTEKERADHAAKRVQSLEGQVTALRDEVSDSRREASEARDLRQRLSALESTATEAEVDRRATKSQLDKLESDRKASREKDGIRRDWALLCAFAIFSAFALLVFGLRWSAGALGVGTILALLWTALAQDVEKVSLKGVAVIVGLVATLAGTLEARWPSVVRQFRATETTAPAITPPHSGKMQ